MVPEQDEPRDGTADQWEHGLAAAFGDVEREELPETLGDYRIHGVLGRGGMGVVYDAEESFP